MKIQMKLVIFKSKDKTVMSVLRRVFAPPSANVRLRRLGILRIM